MRKNKVPVKQPALKKFNPINWDVIKPQVSKLKGEYLGRWSCSIDYSNRIAFKFMKNPDSGETEILLLTVGSHDDLY